MNKRWEDYFNVGQKRGDAGWTVFYKDTLKKLNVTQFHSKAGAIAFAQATLMAWEAKADEAIEKILTD